MSLRRTPPTIEGKGIRARSLASKLAVFGAAAALVIAPSIVSASVAHAAAPGPTVTTPANGATGVAQSLPNVVDFAGGNLPAGDSIWITYVDEDGTRHAATNTQNGDGGNGNWTISGNFSELSAGQTAVTATVTANTPGVDNNGQGTPDPAYDPTTVNFTLAEAPNPTYPFAITTPANGSTVTSTTPAFVGTGEPGTTVTLNYSGRNLASYTAGTVDIDDDGNWTIDPTDFSGLNPGAMDVRIDVTDSNGDSFFHNITFATAPVPANPVTLTTAPNPVNQTQATTIGVGFEGTGLRPGEQFTVAVTGPDGEAVDLPTPAENFYADDTDGSFVGLVILPDGSDAGDYTITVTGSGSSVTASGDFTVQSDADLAYGVTANPSTLTLAQATTGGTMINVTGFGDDEDLLLAVTDPSGNPVDLNQQQSFSTDDNGSFSYQLILPATAAVGQYRVAVLGADTARAAVGTFTVTANPTTGGTGSLPVVSG